MAKNFEMNLTEGPLLKKIILYSLPLMATNILQLLFNAADVAVLGMFVGDDAVAAVGATGALINLIIGLFVGLSVGANVIVARRAGEGNAESARRTVGTSVVISLLLGFALLFVGYFCAYDFLEMMDCDPEVIDLATKYMQIYFLGMPIMLLYNFTASILRAIGDTVRPMIYLALGGVINIGLNVLFVLAFNMDVEGVAIATVASQLVSAVLSLAALSRSDGYGKLERKKLRIFKRELVDMIKIGVPSGIQSSVFSLSNVLIQSAINSFGKEAMTGNTVASQFDGFIYNAMMAISLAALAFASQNLGAGKLDRIKKSTNYAVAVVTVVGVAVSSVILIFGRQLCGIMTDSSEVIDLAYNRLLILGSTYFLCGIMDVMSNIMRGLGKSTSAMVISLSGNCGFRVLWLNSIYLLFPSLDMLYILYPVSWALTIIVYIFVYRSTIAKLGRDSSLAF